MIRTQSDRGRAAARQSAGSVLLACAIAFSVTTHASQAETALSGEPELALPPLQLLAQDSAKPATRDSLFEDSPAENTPQPARSWQGYFEAAVARAYRDPDHWSKANLRLDVSRRGQFNEHVKWKIGARFDYDAAYDQASFFAPEVRRDQRYEFTLRENYLDISPGGNWEYRIGRQHIVWGELVGAFVADVVSARDFREFILPEPDLQAIRIPQWAVRAEYFGNDVKYEVVWIPVPSFDEIGKPGIPGAPGAAGADFFPHPIPGPGGTVFRGEEEPSRKLSNTNYGFRVSALKNGWDFSGFYYHSLDTAPTFHRRVLPGPVPGLPVFLYQARHDEIDQVGGTVSKDLGNAVLKGEAVYTTGRRFNVTRIEQPDGLVEQDTIDYGIGLDFTLPRDARLNLQFLQRVFLDHDPDTLQRKYESIVSVLVDAVRLGSNLEGRLLVARSLNRSDWLLRPKITWAFERNWRLAAGVDIFSGPRTGAFGRFDDNDRVYAEIRYTF